MPVPPEATKKAQREQRRAEKVAEFQRKQRGDRRKRRFGIAGGILAAVVVLGLVAAVIVVNAQPKADPDSISITGLKTFSNLDNTHTTDPVDYEAKYGMSPPAGGSHNPVWLNCGIYDQVQQNEHAVHALEHGAVWITYNADEVTGSDLDELRSETPSTYAVLSPYPDLQAPVVISAWGEQVQLKSVSDPRLKKFIDKFWQSPNVPEAGASCSGALDGPGRVS